MNTITSNQSASQFSWAVGAMVGQPYNGNAANIQVYLLDGTIVVSKDYQFKNSLAANICEIAVNAKADSFISKVEIMTAQNECSRLFPADYMLAKVDKLVRKHSCFDSMADMLAAPNYRPTLYCSASTRVSDRQELKLIADYYDACMEQLGDSRRAYRV